MTREQFAKMIRWPFIFWLVGIVNPFFMVPQLVAVWESRLVEGISLLMLVMALGIQAGFGAHGFFKRDRALMWSNAAAALVTFATVASVLYIRG